MAVLRNRLINVASAVVAAGIAVGCVSAYNCGSAKEIDLQSPSLLGPDAVPFEDLFYGQDLQAEETAFVSMSMGNFDINDYTIKAVSTYTDIAAEFGTDPSDPVSYDGGMYWLMTDTVVIPARSDSGDEDQNDDNASRLKLGDSVTRISYIRDWSLIKLENGQQGYVLNSKLSPTLIDPETYVSPTPTPTDAPAAQSDSDSDSSSSSGNSGSGSNSSYNDADDDDDDDDDDEPSNSGSSSSSGNDYEETPCDFTVYSSCALNTRTGPGISYTLLSTLAPGTEIHVIAETDNGWYKSDDGYYVKASFTQDTEPTPTPVPYYYDDDDDDDEDWSSFASYIRSFIGCDYVYGGADPSGFDCSGFVMYCYQTYYGIYLPHGATSQSYCGYEVDPDEIQVGDIICFDKEGDGIMEHAGLYVGNDTYVHAKGTAYGVVEDNYSSAKWKIGTVRRVL